MKPLRLPLTFSLSPEVCISILLEFSFLFLKISKFYFFNIYLFTWLHGVLVAALGPFLMVHALLSSCGVQVSEYTNSVVVTHSLTCLYIQAP